MTVLKRFLSYAFFMHFLCITGPASALEWNTIHPLGDTSRLVATGEILGDDPQILEEILTEGGVELRIVELNSEGGNILAGMQLGNILRRYEFTTIVPTGAECVSSCFFMFIGGTERYVAPDANLGMHQFVGIEDTGSAQSLVGLMLTQLVIMGVSNSALAGAFSTPPDQMYYFTQPELKEYGLLSGPKSKRKLSDTAIIMKFNPNAPHRPGCPFPDGAFVANDLGWFPQCD